MDNPISRKCELLETCGFFLKFTSDMEVIKKGWIYMYCDDRYMSDQCLRKIFRQKTGVAPPDNMTPTGIFMEDVKDTE